MTGVRIYQLFPAILWLAAELGLVVVARAADSKPPPAPQGSILCEFFRGIPGGDVKDLTVNHAFPDSPTSQQLISSFEIPADTGDDYGTRVRGYLYPPATGDYTFWIAGDDAGQLLLSTTDSPAQKQLICQCPQWTDPRQWDKFPEQKSKPIPLTAGKIYYVEALHKQAGGPSHLCVGWKLPDGKEEKPIPGSRLCPAAQPRPPRPLHVSVDPTTQPATTSGFHKFPLAATIDGAAGSFKMSYLLYLPKEYAASQDKKPMFIFLCGNGHQGTDLNGIFNEGPASYLSNDKSLRDTVRFIGFFPQPPPNTRWDTPGMAAAVAALIPKIEEAYRVDPDRVYLTGLSMGGKGTWLVSQENPNLFAAIAPISAVAVNPETAGPRLKNLPAWIICGSDDGDFTAGSKKMTEILKQAGDDVTLEVREHEGHGVWGHYYAAHQFYDRLLTWKRIPAAAQAAATQAAQ